MKQIICIVLLLSLPLFPKTQVSVSSPNSTNTVAVSSDYGKLCYSVSVRDKAVITDSELGWEFKSMPYLGNDLEIIDTQLHSIDYTWQPVWGTHKNIRDHANELTINLKESKAPGRKIDLIIRAYNDGIAFRYAFPEQDGITDFKLLAEYTEFRFTGNHNTWAADYGTFITHQEEEYKPIKLGSIRPGKIIGCPLLVEAGDVWLGMSEANLTDWAGMYFTGSNKPFTVTTLLSPRLDEPDVAVISRTPRFSPWRVIMIADNPGKLIESNLIVNLNDPCEIKDPTWITTGLSAWDRWWCGSYAPDYDDKLGVDTPSMKYFIDFAAEMGWEYQLVDWVWYGDPFDPAKPFGTAGNPDVSILKQTDIIDIPELVEYGKKKGVKILIWLDWFHADKDMEKAFPLYEKWGVAGVKVDFMTRDDQYMVNFYHRLVKLAAKHHLTVDFHGAYKPTGFRRTYPNLLTREGVLGNEYNKWSARVTLEHTVILPFTRMLCGPMDFTPGGYRNKSVKDFKFLDDGPGPFVMGTRCHQLAMMVVYESPLQVLCDSPYSYRMSPNGLDFLKMVPATWDDTRFLEGFPGQFIVMARQSGKDWYIGGMTGDDERETAIKLDFLDKGEYTATIWADAEEAADYPEHVWQEQRTVKQGDVIKVKMASGGGFVVHISPK